MVGGRLVAGCEKHVPKCRRVRLGGRTVTD